MTTYQRGLLLDGHFVTQDNLRQCLLSQAKMCKKGGTSFVPLSTMSEYKRQTAQRCLLSQLAKVRLKKHRKAHKTANKCQRQVSTTAHHVELAEVQVTLSDQRALVLIAVEL